MRVNPTSVLIHHAYLAPNISQWTVAKIGLLNFTLKEWTGRLRKCTIFPILCFIFSTFLNEAAKNMDIFHLLTCRHRNFNLIKFAALTCWMLLKLQKYSKNKVFDKPSGITCNFKWLIFNQLFPSEIWQFYRPKKENPDNLWVQNNSHSRVGLIWYHLENEIGNLKVWQLFLLSEKTEKIYLQVGEKAIFLQWIPLVSNFLALICFHLENPVKIIRLED